MSATQKQLFAKAMSLFPTFFNPQPLKKSWFLSYFMKTF